MIPSRFKNLTTRPSRRLVLAGLASVPLAGCFGPHGPAFTAQAAAETLSSDPVLHVITTRKLARDLTKSPFLDAARASQLGYVRALLRAPDTSALGKINALVNKDFAVQRVEAVSTSAAAAQLASELRGKDSLLYVHGYNQTFESAALEAAQLSDGIGFRGNSVLFSWPSKGGLLDYGYDRESALLARDPFADALSALLKDEFGARLHLVAHSMGTLVTLETLRSYRDRHGDKGIDRLGALVLAAPDIDADLFKASVARLGPWREKILVITATNDRALDLSRQLAGGARAGALPPEALEGTGVKAVDATDFSTGLVRHDAFLSNADVRAVIRRAVERA
jgi:esterase/lipase superfamily enzyme